MYGHQVVEAFQSYLKSPKIVRANPLFGGAFVDISRVFRPTLHKLIQGLQSAHHFHLGDLSNIRAVFGDYEGDLFMGKTAANIRLPYPECWVDFLYDVGPRKGTKLGVYAQELAPDLIEIYILGCSRNGWVPSPLKYWMKIGRFFCDDPDFLEARAPYDLFRFLLPASRKEFKGNMFPLPAFDTAHFPLERIVENAEALQDSDCIQMSALNWALMLLACKNIGTKVHLPSESLNRKRAKDGKPPVFKHHTLVLKPLAPKKKGQSKEPQGLWETPRHWCMGHPRYYREEAKMCGKYAGWVWVPAHQRGSRKRGVVTKDYELSPSRS